MDTNNDGLIEAEDIKKFANKSFIFWQDDVIYYFLFIFFQDL